jgi:hypothetical protein
MSWKSIKIKLDRSGMDAMLKSKPVENAVADIAEEVAVKSYDNMPTHETGPLSYEVFTEEIRTRVVATVKTEHQLGPALERKYGPLRKALKSLEE